MGETMSLERAEWAVGVLNSRNHRDLDSWKLFHKSQTESEVYSPENQYWWFSLDEAVAIAERYERLDAPPADAAEGDAKLKEAIGQCRKLVEFAPHGSVTCVPTSSILTLLAAAEAGPRVGEATKRIVEAAVRAMDGFDSVKHRGCGYRFATWLALEDIVDALRELGMEAG